MVTDHYARLEAHPTATHEELRACYLRLARAHHPDLTDPERRRDAERRMQEINDAWAVLGSARDRDLYDRELAMARGSSGPSTARTRGHAEFRAFDDEPVVRNDADTDPTPFASSRAVPRWISLMPIVLVLVAVPVVGLGLLVAASGIIAFGAVVFALGAVGFLAMPLFVMSRAERDPRM